MSQKKSKKQELKQKQSLQNNYNQIDEINRQISLQDLKTISYLANFTSSITKLMDGEAQIKLKEISQHIERLNIEFGLGITDLKEKIIDFICPVHQDNECLLKSIILDEPIYEPQDCNCKAMYCKEILSEQKCPTCRQEDIEFNPIENGDLYLALEFNSLQQIYNFQSLQDIPQDIQIIMVRLAYMVDVLKVDIQNIINKIKDSEEKPFQGKLFSFRYGEQIYYIPEFIDYQSCHQKLIKTVNAYQDLQDKLDSIYGLQYQ